MSFFFSLQTASGHQSKAHPCSPCAALCFKRIISPESFSITDKNKLKSEGNNHVLAKGEFAFGQDYPKIQRIKRYFLPLAGWINTPREGCQRLVPAGTIPAEEAVGGSALLMRSRSRLSWLVIPSLIGRQDSPAWSITLSGAELQPEIVGAALVPKESHHCRAVELELFHDCFHTRLGRGSWVHAEVEVCSQTDGKKVLCGYSHQLLCLLEPTPQIC